MPTGTGLPSERSRGSARRVAPPDDGLERLPDPLRVDAARAAPGHGPCIAFLTGGSALRDLSSRLIEYTHGSVHLVTPFDSGGSSAPLREAFRMLAVGDLRNRLLALAPAGDPPAAALKRLLGERLSRRPRDSLVRQLQALAGGRDPRLAALADAPRALVREGIGRFLERVPDGFDLPGASLGNLVLTGLYLPDRDIGAALSRLAALLDVRGRVLPTVDANLHLAARLADGTRVIGQHRLTGKEHPPLASRIEELYLVDRLDAAAVPVSKRPVAAPDVLRLVHEADLVCYPMGSFYTSVVCNLLPEGLGRAIAEAPCPKLYVPSMGRDPELLDLDPSASVEALLAALRADAGPETPTDRLLNGVLLDPDASCYAVAPDVVRIARTGAEPIAVALAAPGEPRRVDPGRLAEILVSLARPPRGDGVRR